MVPTATRDVRSYSDTTLLISINALFRFVKIPAWVLNQVQTEIITFTTTESRGNASKSLVLGHSGSGRRVPETNTGSKLTGRLEYPSQIALMALTETKSNRFFFGTSSKVTSMAYEIF